MPSPGALGQVPIFKNFLKWFNQDEQKTDNILFQMHHKFTTAILMFGLMFVFLENHLDGRAINCKNADSYAQSYCWIHGTGYVKQHLQGESTGCYVDQSKMTDNEWNGRVTAYYLWIPFLLTFCIGFCKLPRVLWKKVLEGGLMQNILHDKNPDPAVVAENFIELRKRFAVYHLHFAICEALNIVMIFVNMFMCDTLLVNKFWTYGVEVLDFLGSFKRYGEMTHNPMCELFPTEVACYITIGATTGGKDQNNYLCILSNNLFNQKYFLIVWLWWVFLLLISVLGMFYRVSKIVIPGLSRLFLLRKVEKSWRRPFNNLNLSKAEYFVLDRISNVVSRKVFNQVILELEKRECLPAVALEESPYDQLELEPSSVPSAPVRTPVEHLEHRLLPMPDFTQYTEVNDTDEVFESQTLLVNSKGQQEQNKAKEAEVSVYENVDHQSPGWSLETQSKAQRPQSMPIEITKEEDKLDKEIKALHHSYSQLANIHKSNNQLDYQPPGWSLDIQSKAQQFQQQIEQEEKQETEKGKEKLEHLRLEIETVGQKAEGRSNEMRIRN